MKNELKVLFTAIMFYTRFPVPKNTGYSKENLNKATRYFPLIGIIIGGLGAIVFWGANHILSQHISILLSLALMILATGAFHEDAISDFCDGFGGGYGKEKILEIMKDSRIGTYGAVALGILLLSKFVLLGEIQANKVPFVLIAAHALSRFNAVVLIFTSQYVREDITSKSKPIGEKNNAYTFIIALIFGLMPLYFIPWKIALIQIAFLGLILMYFRHYIHKKIGGYTGDVLGALQQFSEIAFYLSFITLNTYL